MSCFLPFSVSQDKLKQQVPTIKFWNLGLKIKFNDEWSVAACKNRCLLCFKLIYVDVCVCLYDIQVFVLFLHATCQQHYLVCFFPPCCAENMLNCHWGSFELCIYKNANIISVRQEQLLHNCWLFLPKKHPAVSLCVLWIFLIFHSK